MLAFEAIPELGSKFRVDVDNPEPTCPRMCQTKFKQSEMKGFPLWKINKELGNTQVSYPSSKYTKNFVIRIRR